MLPLAIGVGLGAAGQVANYFGGKSEAKRKQKAIDRYNRDSAAAYDAMMKDAWAAGQERQRGTGQVIEGLRPTMGAPASDVPQLADFMPAEEADPSGLRGDAYRQAMATAGKPRQKVNQSQAVATQAGMDRAALARALDALGFSSTVEAQTKAPEHQRLQWQKRQELEAMKARLESALGKTGNAARNLQLLGSLLGTAGQATMMAGAFGGGPTAAVPGAMGAGTVGVMAPQLAAGAGVMAPGLLGQMTAYPPLYPR
jgi:hypothetical protein